MNDKHISEEDLERHYLDRLPDEAELRAIQKHLRGCEKCVQRAKAVAAMADAFKAALALLNNCESSDRKGVQSELVSATLRN